MHISELADHKVENPEEIVKVGEEIEVKILRVDTEDRKIGLSPKTRGAVEEDEAAARRGTRRRSRWSREELRGGTGAGSARCSRWVASRLRIYRSHRTRSRRGRNRPKNRPRSGRTAERNRRRTGDDPVKRNRGSRASPESGCRCRTKPGEKTSDLPPAAHECVGLRPRVCSARGRFHALRSSTTRSRLASFRACNFAWTFPQRRIVPPGSSRHESDHRAPIQFSGPARSLMVEAASKSPADKSGSRTSQARGRRGPPDGRTWRTVDPSAGSTSVPSRPRSQPPGSRHRENHGTPMQKTSRRRTSSSAVQSPLETYLREINETALLTANEEKELSYRIADGDKSPRPDGPGQPAAGGQHRPRPTPAKVCRCRI